MKVEEIRKTVHNYYWQDDFNCATTVMYTLAEVYTVKIQEQVTNTLIGMHGAGKYGAQCGLVEGVLMFLGIYGKISNYDNGDIVNLCYKFANGYEKKFGSLRCSDLRPEGFHKDNPSHLCEMLTVKSIEHAINFIDETILQCE